ncbi:hypothetical protein HG15A2_26000 [Adhaeretor mobilis]|uniref:Uncharacterized protein n=1 Tax=Adhaeretor mobilis TaxID=1930276 RepID=A0A517MWM6_9BACT|nr:hypothetical protein HG15A2_26000 [Adhaeretor mobilis]
MRRIILPLLTLASLSIGCTGSQEVVVPSRENFNTGEVTVHELGSNKRRSNKLETDELGTARD